MKARYLGNPSPQDDGPRRVGFAGKTFARGVFVPVDDLAQDRIAKLRGNRFFEVSEDELTADEAKAVEEAASEAEAEAADQPSDGAVPDDKPALLAALEGLKAKHPDVEFDAKWGVAKLKAALEEARFIHDDEG